MSKTHSFYFVASLRNTFWYVLVFNASCCCKLFFNLKICDLIVNLKPKYLFTECILFGFKTNHFEMFNDIIYTNKATEPFLPLKYLVYPKRSFHWFIWSVIFFFLNTGRAHTCYVWFCAMMWPRCWVNSFVFGVGCNDMICICLVKPKRF